MPISTWIRDILGIRKDIVETTKAQLEVEQLKSEKRERDLITPAAFADIQKYDPKHARLVAMIEPPRTCSPPGRIIPAKVARPRWQIIATIVVIGALVLLAVLIIRIVW